jgi:hypothetical protein
MIITIGKQINDLRHTGLMIPNIRISEGGPQFHYPCSAAANADLLFCGYPSSVISMSSKTTWLKPTGLGLISTPGRQCSDQGLEAAKPRRQSRVIVRTNALDLSMAVQQMMWKANNLIPESWRPTTSNNPKQTQDPASTKDLTVVSAYHLHKSKHFQ